MHTHHVSLRYVMEKKDAKLQLIRWILLLQEFDFEVNDHKGREHQLEYHISKLINDGKV